MNRTPPLPLAGLCLTLALLLPGCAASTAGRYPSLLPRPIEKRSDAEPTPEVQEVKPDAVLEAKIKALTDAQTAGAAALTEVAARAERAVAAAAGAAAGSERWIEAQSVLAELDSFRADASSRLSDFEQLAIERGTAGLPDYPALDAARAAAENEGAAQAERISRLQSRLAES